MSKVDKKRHAELSERVDDLTIKLEDAEQEDILLKAWRSAYERRQTLRKGKRL